MSAARPDAPTPGGWRHVVVYVAGRTAGGTLVPPSEHERWVAAWRAVLAGLTGGAATVHAAETGWWRGVAEPVVRVSAFVSEAAWVDRGRAVVTSTARQYAAMACQETVLVTAERWQEDEVCFIIAHDSLGVVSAPW